MFLPKYEDNSFYFGLTNRAVPITNHIWLVCVDHAHYGVIKSNNNVSLAVYKLVEGQKNYLPWVQLYIYIYNIYIYIYIRVIQMKPGQCV